MNKCLLFLGALLLLPVLWGCGAEAQVWERVEDGIPVLADQSLSDYRITFGVPDEAVLETAGQTEGPMLYSGPGGDYEIMSQRIEADSLETVVKDVTGFRLDELSPVRRKEFSMDRYDLAWAFGDEEGQKVARAAILCDGGAYYVVSFSVRETAAESCAGEMERVFSTIGLQADEGF